jgi:hypothetical protein
MENAFTVEGLRGSLCHNCASYRCSLTLCVSESCCSATPSICQDVVAKLKT